MPQGQYSGSRVKYKLCRNADCNVLYLKRNPAQKYCSVLCRNRHNRKLYPTDPMKKTCPDCGKKIYKESTRCGSCSVYRRHALKRLASG